MAAPTPTKYSRQVGRNGFLHWTATWATTDNMTDTVVIDLSAAAEGYTHSLTIQRVIAVCTAGIDALLEIDSTTDEPILSTTLGNVTPLDVDFCAKGREGAVKQGTGGTGDLLITTTSADINDKISLWIWYKVS